MSGMVKVKFLKSYSASRGPAIYGAKGEEKQIRMGENLQALIESGVCELCKGTAASTRKKATKKSAEKS